jgi:hypothetical protein
MLAHQVLIKLQNTRTLSNHSDWKSAMKAGKQWPATLRHIKYFVNHQCTFGGMRHADVVLVEGLLNKWNRKGNWEQSEYGHFAVLLNYQDLYEAFLLEADDLLESKM